MKIKKNIQCPQNAAILGRKSDNFHFTRLLCKQMKNKKKKGPQNQVNEPTKVNAHSNTEEYKNLYKSFAGKRSRVGRIRLMRLPDKQLSSRSSGVRNKVSEHLLNKDFKSLFPLLELRFPGPALNNYSYISNEESGFNINGNLITGGISRPFEWLGKFFG